MSTAISPDSYSRRQKFIADMKSMSRSEYIEVARILKKHNVPLSENRSGLFFDLSKLTEEIFLELLAFQEFVTQNTKDLKKRDEILRGLVTNQSKA